MSAQQHDTKTAVFETMSVPKALAIMAIPGIVSQFISLLYNITDIWFIGRTNNPYMIGASSLVLIFYMLLVAISNLFGTGGGNLLARQLGKGDLEGAQKTCSYSITTCGFVALAFSLLVFATMNPLLMALGASENTLEFARQYTLFAIVLGGVPTTLSYCMPMIMRNAGYAKEAGIGVALYNIINIALDPLLMFVVLPDGYQLMAAGIANLITYLVALAYFVIVYRRLESKSVLRLPKGLVRLDKDARASLYSVGIPAALMMVLFNSLGVVLNRLAVAHGETALAAVGIIVKLERLPQNLGMATCLGMAPLIAYNFARRDYKRANRFFTAASITLLAIGLTSTALFFLFAKPIVHAFIDDAETVSIGAALLRARSTYLPFMVLDLQLVYYMQAIGQGKYALVFVVVKHLVLSIPLMIVFDRLWGIDGLIWSQTVAEVLTFVFCYIVYLRVRKRIEV